MCLYPIEREFTSRQAVEAIKLWLKEHNLHSSLYTTVVVVVVNKFRTLT